MFRSSGFTVILIQKQQYCIPCGQRGGVQPLQSLILWQKGTCPLSGPSFLAKMPKASVYPWPPPWGHHHGPVIDDSQTPEVHRPRSVVLKNEKFTPKTHMYTKNDGLEKCMCIRQISGCFPSPGCNPGKWRFVDRDSDCHLNLILVVTGILAGGWTQVK